ncbi:DUF4328 domain-containing protein [Zhouia amylolytica]|uniref:DUF4328 domain-containing protein n=1 Tax=Zhouia amylolytica TaxID=376730 RepID=UPI0020CCDEFB|nr:DUF4328 domain-containing protein [Zhouia amylolytica]MCQ0113045.1 DUF4328 domain-containing protein [Zhouia amylolytica]
MNLIENTQENDLSVKIEIWDNTKRAKNLMIIFWILTGLTFIAIISGYFELQLLENVKLGIFPDESEVYANDLRQGIIGIIQTGIYITSIILFLNWFRRAYGNLHRLGISYLKHKESMAVWAWFIPIIVLFRPVQIMNEIWNETQEKIKKFDSTYIIKNGGLIIGLWWALFIISNIIGRYVLRTVFKAETVEQLIEGSQALLLSDFMQIPEALLVILIVFQLSKMETKLAKEVQQAGGNIIYK